MTNGCFLGCTLWCMGAAHAAQGSGTGCCRGLQQRCAVAGAKGAGCVSLWAAMLSPHIECRAISHIWIWLLDCCKGASAEAQEAQKGPAGAAGQLLAGMCCIIRIFFECCSALCAGLL